MSVLNNKSPLVLAALLIFLFFFGAVASGSSFIQSSIVPADQLHFRLDDKKAQSNVNAKDTLASVSGSGSGGGSGSGSGSGSVSHKIKQEQLYPWDHVRNPPPCSFSCIRH